MLLCEETSLTVYFQHFFFLFQFFALYKNMCRYYKGMERLIAQPMHMPVCMLTLKNEHGLGGPFELNVDVCPPAKKALDVDLAPEKL